MNKLGLSALALLMTQASFGATLKCWKTNFQVKTPFMTATIEADDQLSDVQFHYHNTLEAQQDNPGFLQGTLITSNHSPYKGNNSYDLPSGDTLVLPPDLSSRNLLKVEKNGIGMNKNENGVIFGFNHEGDGEGGGHFSERLTCRSDKR